MVTQASNKIKECFPKYKRESFFGVPVKYSVPIARKYKTFISQQTDKESFAKLYQSDFCKLFPKMLPTLHETCTMYIVHTTTKIQFYLLVGFFMIRTEKVLS